MNVQGKIENNKLILVIDVSPEAIAKAEPSKSGKSKVVASTQGFTSYGNGVKVSLNVTA